MSRVFIPLSSKKANGQVQGTKPQDRLPRIIFVLAAALPFAFCVLLIFPSASLAQQKLAAANLSDFLAKYDTNFGPLETVFKELNHEDLPLRDEAGQPLARRPIEDRLAALSPLRQTARQFAAKPEDLVLATTIVIQTESLADDLFDLSQVAYDNDREELGNRLSTLEITMEQNKQLLADYLLTLAAEKQDRLQQLEKEVDELHRKLKEGTTQPTPGVE
jgi:uncharacterized coiled-coil protein SlyX